MLLHFSFHLLQKCKTMICDNVWMWCSIQSGFSWSVSLKVHYLGFLQSAGYIGFPWIHVFIYFIISWNIPIWSKCQGKHTLLLLYLTYMPALIMFVHNTEVRACRLRNKSLKLWDSNFNLKLEIIRFFFFTTYNKNNVKRIILYSTLFTFFHATNGIKFVKLQCKK